MVPQVILERCSDLKERKVYGAYRRAIANFIVTHWGLKLLNDKATPKPFGATPGPIKLAIALHLARLPAPALWGNRDQIFHFRYTGGAPGGSLSFLALEPRMDFSAQNHCGVCRLDRNLLGVFFNRAL